MSAIKDICDYAKTFGKNALRESLQRDSGPANTQSASSATSANTPPPPQSSKSTSPKSPAPWPPITNAQDLLSIPAKRPPEIISGLLHQSSKMVLGGGSKSFKTWSLLDLSISVATGEPWWGFATHKSRVLYVNLELPEWSIAERIREIKEARVIMEKLTNLDLLNLRGFAASFDEMQNDILLAVGQTYGMIVVDPIYKVYGDRDENSAGEMGALLNLFEQVAVQSGAAVVFGAHFSKGNQSQKDSLDRISGSGVFARDPDTILVMTKHEVNDAFTVDVTLRNLKPIDSFCVERKHPIMERNNALNPKKLKTNQFQTQYTPEMLLTALGDEGLNRPDWFEKVVKETGMSERTFGEKLKELKAAKRVQVNDDKLWTKTPATTTDKPQK